MPPRLPERYRLNIRLGSDGDIEEWLAQDENLDRPVLIRYLAPESTQDRHGTFLEGVQAAAALTEIHLQRVFAAGETTASAYSVSEWDGGVTIADRLRVGEGLPVEEFLPNASGLCTALGRFHEAGGIHGAIDISAVHFSAAHPAKLGAFGRQRRWSDQSEDTMALAEVLRAAITGTEDPAVFPSAVIDGLPPSTDEALKAGVAGELDAYALATALSAVHYEAPEEITPQRPWRALALFAAIVVLISLVAAVGLAANFDPDSAFLFPVGAEPSAPTTTVPVPVSDLDETDDLQSTVEVYDPFGDGTESDDSVDLVLDGNPLTAWQTEAYSGPIRDFKDGVGLVFEVEGVPSAMYVLGTVGTTYVVGWSASLPEDPANWEHIARGTLQEGETRIQLAERSQGLWRFWLTGLPERPDGSYQSRIASVRFVPVA
ncbi:MAG: hypothetical protein ACR2N2_10150 [Acidimicrobiia bacterium]